MRSGFLFPVMLGVSGFLVQGCDGGHALPAYGAGPAPQHSSPHVLGNIDLDDDPDDKGCKKPVMNPFIVRLHVPALFFQSAAAYTKAVHPASLCSGHPSCVSISNSNGSAFSDHFKEHYLEAAIFYGGTNIPQTPFDIDLGYPTKNDGRIWDGSSTRIEIRIVLDDSNVVFIIDPSLRLPDTPYSATVTQGRIGQGMFVCAPQGGMDDVTGKQMIKFRAVTSKLPYGGLNIGVMFKAGNGNIIPLVIDPQIKNTG